MALVTCPECSSKVSTEALVCPHCGKPGPFGVSKKPKLGLGPAPASTPTPAPSPTPDSTIESSRMLVVPFQVNAEKIAERVAEYMAKGGVFSPSDVRQAGMVSALRKMQVPVRVFFAKLTTHWTAEVRELGQWTQVSGQLTHEHKVVGQPVAAVNGLYLHGATRVAMKYLDEAEFNEQNVHDADQLPSSDTDEVAIQKARQQVEARQTKACQQEVLKGQKRALRKPPQVNHVYESVRLDTTYLPVWAGRFAYGGRQHRFTADGVEGRVWGRKPVSYTKSGICVGVFGIVACLLILKGGLSDLSARPEPTALSSTRSPENNSGGHYNGWIGSNSGGRSSNDSTPPAKTVDKNELFSLGQYSYIISDVTVVNSISDGFTVTRPPGGAKYVAAYYRIRNDGNTTTTVLSSDFKLDDGRGRMYSASSEAETALIFAGVDGDLIISQLQPGVWHKSVTAFLVPEEVAEGKFDIVIPEKGLFGTSEARIRLQ